MEERKHKGPKSPAGKAYVKRLDFARKIHDKLDDGALLALCEYYGDEEDPEEGER